MIYNDKQGQFTQLAAYCVKIRIAFWFLYYCGVVDLLTYWLKIDVYKESLVFVKLEKSKRNSVIICF